MDSNQGQKKDTPPPPFFKVPRLEEAPSVQRSIRTVVLDSPAFQALAFSITKLQQANQEEVKKMSSKKKTSNDVSGSKQPKKR